MRIAILVASVLTALASLPAPSWLMWQARFMAIEARPLTLTLAVGGGITALVQRRHAWLLTATLVMLSTMWPVARILSQTSAPICWISWITGVSAPDVPLRRSIVLEASRPDRVMDRWGTGRRWVLAVHGGSWQHGTRAEYDFLWRKLAEAGWSVFSVDYRLAPAHPFPAAAEDVAHAFRDVQQHAATLGVDPAAGALIGRSAGGHLVLVAGHGGSDLGCPITPRAVIALYAPTDLAWGHDNPLWPSAIDGPATIRTFLGGPPELRAAVYHRANPSTHVHAASPPTLLVHGAADSLVTPRHAGFFARALSRAGRPVREVLVHGADHAFDIRPGGLGEQIARAEILRFLEEVAR